MKKTKEFLGENRFFLAVMAVLLFLNIRFDFYYIKTGSMGKSLPVGTIAIVNTDANPTAFYQGKENAQKGISAQRLVYDAWGNVTKAIDGEQNTTEFVLDAWGRITEIHTPEGGTEHYTYDY